MWDTTRRIEYSAGAVGSIVWVGVRCILWEIDSEIGVLFIPIFCYFPRGWGTQFCSAGEALVFQNFKSLSFRNHGNYGKDLPCRRSAERTSIGLLVLVLQWMTSCLCIPLFLSLACRQCCYTLQMSWVGVGNLVKRELRGMVWHQLLQLTAKVEAQRDIGAVGGMDGQETNHTIQEFQTAVFRNYGNDWNFWSCR